MMKILTAVLGGLAILAAPTLAAAAPVQPAAALSVAHATQAPTQDGTARPRRGVPGGGIIAGVLLAGVIGVAVLLFSQDDDADSN